MARGRHDEAGQSGMQLRQWRRPAPAYSGRNRAVGMAVLSEQRVPVVLVAAATAIVAEVSNERAAIGTVDDQPGDHLTVAELGACRGASAV